MIAEIRAHKKKRKKNEKKRLCKQQNSSSHQLRKRGHLGRKAPLHQKRKGRSVRIRRVASRQASRPLLISLKLRRMLERTSGLHKLLSIVHRMGMKSLRARLLALCESRPRLFRGTNV